MVKNLPANAGDPGDRPRFYRWVRKIPWRRKWQRAPVILPGKSHDQRNLLGYNSWGHRELDMTEPLSAHTFFLSICLVINSCFILTTFQKIAFDFFYSRDACL